MYLFYVDPKNKKTNNNKKNTMELHYYANEND